MVKVNGYGLRRNPLTYALVGEGDYAELRHWENQEV